MCSRYAITLPPAAMRAAFCYEETPAFPPRDDVAPGQPIPIVARDHTRIGVTARHFRLVRWGFVPGYVKDFARAPLLFNARGEEIADKPSFRAAMMRRRCLVIADGYYAWRPREGRRTGTPYLIRRRDGAPFGFAGLWEPWLGADGSEIDTACIVTTAAGGLTAAIHPRMPVILDDRDFEAWLDVEGVRAEAAAALLRPARDDRLAVWEIGPGPARGDDARRLSGPARVPDDPRQGSLF